MGLPLCGGFFFKGMKYTIDKKFRGRMLVGDTTYDSKPPKWMGGKIKNEVRREVFVTNSTLAEMIGDGLPYCPAEKNLEDVSTSDYICIDIDFSTEPMDKFVSALAFQPTIYYETESNDTNYSVGKSLKHFNDRDHKYRFRLIYALKTPTTSVGEYIAAFDYIVKENNIDKEIVDGRTANQLYFGSYNCKCRVTDYVYELPEEYKENIEKEEKTKKCQKQTNSLSTTYTFTSDTFFEKEVLSSFFKLEYLEFLEWYDRRFGRPFLLVESEYVQSEEDERKKVLKDKYYTIPVKKYWDKEMKRFVTEKWNDGEQRHKRIFLSGLILRKLNKDIDHNVMLYAIVNTLLCHYDLDDPDGNVKFTHKYIVDLVDRIMKAGIREMTEVKHSSFKVSEKYCKEHSVSKKQVLGSLLGEKNREKKEERYREIDCFYDPSLTLSDGKKITHKQWIGILEENGVKVSIETFKRYLKERGFSKTNKERKTKKCQKQTNSLTTNTYTFTSDTFSENEEDESSDGQDGQFREIDGRIHDTDEFKRKWTK